MEKKMEYSMETELMQSLSWFEHLSGLGVPSGHKEWTQGSFW